MRIDFLFIFVALKRAYFCYEKLFPPLDVFLSHIRSNDYLLLAQELLDYVVLNITLFHRAPSSQ